MFINKIYLPPLKREILLEMAFFICVKKIIIKIKNVTVKSVLLRIEICSK